MTNLKSGATYGVKKPANTFVALLRAVNVTGVNALRAEEFVRILEAIGLGNIRTYIQTGNAVFEAAGETQVSKLAEKIKAAIQRAHGFAPEVILLRADELESAIAANPYTDVDSNPKALHLVFLTSAPGTPDLSALEKIRKPSEQFSLKGKVFYFYAPEGVGRSKLFSRIEKSLGVAGTARNWRTSCKLLEMTRENMNSSPA